MALFQKSLVTKYVNSLDKAKIAEKWNIYKSYFLNPDIQTNIRSSKEEQYQGEFLIDLFVKVLGYIKNPSPNFNLTTEYKNEKDSKKADGAILINEQVIAVIELKDTNTTDLQKIEMQAFGYKNNQKNCVYVITSNFEKLRFYIDNTIEHEEFNLFTLDEKQFEILYLCLAYENIAKNIPKKLKDDSINQEDIITKQLYKDYSLFKDELFNNLTKLNPNYDTLELFKKSQKLIDRFLFIFFAEDRQLLQPNSVRLIIEQWKQLKDLDEYVPLYDRFKKYFGYLNSGYKSKQLEVYPYNGGLFKDDKILDNLTINDELLYKHTLKLSEYDFASEVDVNILGHIFENSLNELDEIKARLEGVGIDKSKTKRKKDGVFYTPKYITKYIVENTVGKLCAEKKQEIQINDEDYAIESETANRKFTNAELRERKQELLDKLKNYRKWLLDIKIIDPACGSGAFLNEALNFLIAEHQYLDELENKLLGGSIVFPNIEVSILENNLFGVDLNEESVEIAKLSLWLRTAQPHRKLSDLSKNIKCGNSLIDDPEIAGEKAFKWEEEFPQVFFLNKNNSRSDNTMNKNNPPSPLNKGEQEKNNPRSENNMNKNNPPSPLHKGEQDRIEINSGEEEDFPLHKGAMENSPLLKGGQRGDLYSIPNTDKIEDESNLTSDKNKNKNNPQSDNTMNKYNPPSPLNKGEQDRIEINSVEQENSPFYKVTMENSPLLKGGQRGDLYSIPNADKIEDESNLTSDKNKNKYNPPNPLNKGEQEKNNPPSPLSKGEQDRIEINSGEEEDSPLNKVTMENSPLFKGGQRGDLYSIPNTDKSENESNPQSENTMNKNNPPSPLSKGEQEKNSSDKGEQDRSEINSGEQEDSPLYKVTMENSPLLKGGQRGDLYSNEDSSFNRPLAIQHTGFVHSVYFLPYNPKNVKRAKELRTNMTAAEKKIWNEFLRKFDYRVNRQRPIDNYIVDFYCSELQLIIEIDGDTHYTDDAMEYDLHRTAVLESYGLKVLRFKNNDVLNNFSGVCQRIMEVKDEIIRNRDSAESDAGIKQESQEEPEITYSGGFDVVIGNPPYVRGRVLQENERRYLDKFGISSNDTAILFIKKSLELISQKGLISFIIPKSLLYASNWDVIRNEIFNRIYKLIDCGKVWDEVLLEQVIFAMSKEERIFYKPGVRKESTIEEFENIENKYAKIFNFLPARENNETLKIALKIKNSSVSLNSVYNNVAGVPNQKYINENGAINMIGGAEFDRYYINKFKGKIDEKWVASENAFIKNNTIIVQNIIAHILYPTEHIKIIACIPSEQHINRTTIANTVNQLILRDSSKINISNKYTWCLLNSKLINWYVYHFVFAFAIRTMHFYNPISEKVPFKFNSEYQQPFIEKADIMLDMNMKLQEHSAKFQRLMQNEFSIDTLPKKLQDWYLLSYGDFIKELAKKKVKLSLSQKAEWEDYFLQQQATALSLKNTIDTTDREIDQLVYALYGLTDEEIKIVESGAWDRGPGVGERVPGVREQGPGKMQE